MTFRHWLVLGLSLAAARASTAAPAFFAPMPNDPYFLDQWHLENRDTNGVSLGIDINARMAWSQTRGEGVTIAIVDNGVDLDHPDLKDQVRAGLSYNFESETADGRHTTDSMFHGTPVAGLAAASGNNARGITGMAPEARFVSWNIFVTNGGPYVNSEKRARMFEFHSQEVAVQNHSWVTEGVRLVPMPAIEDAAISNAVTLGRDGKGVVMVRAGGNGRAFGRNANEDAYLNDPRVITVAGVHSGGRAASYSSPGACLLVAAPAGDLDFGFRNLFTTDRVAQKGFNQIFFPGLDLSDYVFASLGFSGTSGSAPLVSGVVAMMLSVNPSLSFRDVQQVLIHASLQTDPGDPTLQTNGAGYAVSHNTGFGLLDAGQAVALAKRWIARPVTITISDSTSETTNPPDAGLSVGVSNDAAEVPLSLGAIPALPSLGAYADEPTPALPIVDIGLAAEPPSQSLAGKGALIQRGGPTYAAKLNVAVAAGAAFAIVYNNVGTDQLEAMGGTDFVPIPAVFISKRHGEELRDYLAANPEALVRISLAKAIYTFTATRDLVCEHVSLRVRANHPVRGDLRVTLVSPSGTRSVLQSLSTDTQPGPEDWTYTSTQHFYEPTFGLWRVEFSDQAPEESGMIEFVELILRGVPITDTDHDGLADDWEMAQFGSLEFAAKDDPDGDGASNAREQVLGTPAKTATPLEAALSAWDTKHHFLSWNSQIGIDFEILGRKAVDTPFEVLQTVRATSPVSTVVRTNDLPTRFYSIRRK